MIPRPARQLVRDVILGAQRLRLRRPTSPEQAAIARFRASIAAFGAAPSCSGPSWQSNVTRLAELAASSDPRAFLTWDVVRRTMFLEYASYVANELGHLRRRPDWPARWRAALTESPAGLPLPYLLYPRSSANLIHHAYHLARFEEATGRRTSDFSTVIEFGGGYGSMCRLLFKAGFNGRYVIYDLPAFRALQQFFLELAGVTPRNSVVWAESPEDIRRTIQSENPSASPSLFLATWSLSEAPVAVRSELMPIVRGCDACLIAYQENFDGVDNSAYFTQWLREFSHLEWKEIPIPHLPHNRYLFGTVAPR